MISKGSINICLEDLGNEGETDRAFQMIEQYKSAIHAAGCKCLGFTYSNTLDKCTNPRGTIGTFTFDIASRDNKERELKCNHFMFTDEFNKTLVTAEITCARKAKSEGVIK